MLARHSATCSGRRALPSNHAHQLTSRAPVRRHYRPTFNTQDVSVASTSGRGDDEHGAPVPKDNVLLAAFAAGTAVLGTLAFTVAKEPIADLIFELSYGSNGFGVGDAVGGLLWGASLYYATPLQLLLLFLGKLDVERPSDWLLYQLGQVTGQPVNEVSYSAPGSLRAATVGICMAGGVIMAAALNAGLGDATWSVSTGLGACMAAGVYEVGRPTRLTVTQAQTLESQWQDFASFASVRLQRSGRCHESEVFGAFRRSYARYRRPEAIDDATLRDMVRNFHPEIERTPNGYYKNLSVVAAADPFTGQPGALPVQSSGAAPDATLKVSVDVVAASSEANQH